MIEPQDTLLFGIPVKTLNSDWVAATLLSRELLPEIDQVVEYGGDQIVFSVDRDLNGDGTIEHVGIGVYRDHEGKKGRFAVVLTQDPGGRWQSRKAASFGGENDVTFLVDDGTDKLLWNDCLECDPTPVQIYWNGSEYVVEWMDN